MDIQKILVIKLRHLGDVLLSTPVFSHLKRVFPGARVDGYVWKEALPILKGNRAVAKVHTYDREWKRLGFLKRLPHEMALLYRIRKERYDLVVQLTEGERGIYAAWASGAETKVGFVPKKRWVRSLLTHLVKACPRSRHAVETNLDALRVLGFHPSQDQRELEFPIAEEDRRRAGQLAHGKEYAVVHAPSRWRFKCLPPQLMAQVVDRLKMPVVLTGASSEREFVQKIADLATGNVINCAGKTSLGEMGALFQGARGIITVDSVSLHIASALKVPTVALFGPTSEQTWGPWRNPRAEVVATHLSCRPCHLDGCGGSKMSDCLFALSPQRIVEAFERVIAMDSAGGASAASLLVLNSLER